MAGRSSGPTTRTEACAGGRRVDGRGVLLLVLVWAALAAALVGVGELVVHSGALTGLDRHITTAVTSHRSPGLDAVMKAVTWLGSWVAVLVAAAVVAALVVRRRLPVGFLVLAVVAWAGTQGATTAAKRLVQRPRPPQRLWLVTAHGWSWPSGHTATATLVFSVLAAVVWLRTPSSRWRAVALGVAVAAVGAVAFSRVELGVHWSTDVLAGTVFTLCWLVALRTWERARGGAVRDASGAATVGAPGRRRRAREGTAG